MTTTSIDVERAPHSREAWLASNRQGLMEALDRVRRQIERAIDARHSADTAATSGDDSREPEATGTAAALVHLCTALALSNFERDVLLMCAGAELDPKLSALYGRAHDDPRRAWPTFGLALAMLPDPHWSALTPAAPLRHWRLVDVVDPAPLVDSRLRLDERILHFLLGIQHIDVRLAGALTPLTPTTLADETPSPAAIHLSTVLTSEDERESVISVSGPSVIERRAVVAAACAALDRRMLMLSAADVPQAPAERDSFVRLIERELVLTRGVLVLEIDESGSGADHAARRIAERFRGTLIVSSAMRPRELPRTVTAVDLRRPHALPERLVMAAGGPRRSGRAYRAGGVVGRSRAARRADPHARRDCRARQAARDGARAMGVCGEEPAGTRNHGPLCRPERHRQDDGGRGDGERAARWICIASI